MSSLFHWGKLWGKCEKQRRRRGWRKKRECDGRKARKRWQDEVDKRQQKLGAGRQQFSRTSLFLGDCVKLMLAAGGAPMCNLLGPRGSGQEFFWNSVRICQYIRKNVFSETFMSGKDTFGHKTARGLTSGMQTSQLPSIAVTAAGNRLASTRSLRPAWTLGTGHRCRRGW